jgi:site-specific DNA-methyltransferase (adenine-specific)
MMDWQLIQADARRIPLANKSVDLVIGSPPYTDRRSYGINASRAIEPWIKWMLDVTREAIRVSRGLVIWVCAGDGGVNYSPAPEGLLYLANREGIQTPRPDYWLANKPPSGRKWFSNMLEYCLVFGDPHYFDPAPLATPLKYTNGGAFRQRGTNGERKAGSAYPAHKIRKTVPNVFRVSVGGGLMGHPLATENEAPYPVDVPRRFVVSCCPAGGLVLDPFGGGGSTAQACQEEGRRCLSMDIRRSQCELSRRRLTGQLTFF